MILLSILQLTLTNDLNWHPFPHQDDTNMEEQDQTHDQSIEENQQEEQPEDHSIEDNLQQLSESRTSARPNLDSISEYLVRKPKEQPAESDGEDDKHAEEDDGNNTDELLVSKFNGLTP